MDQENLTSETDVLVIIHAIMDGCDKRNQPVRIPERYVTFRLADQVRRLRNLETHSTIGRNKEDSLDLQKEISRVGLEPLIAKGCRDIASLENGIKKAAIAARAENRPSQVRTPRQRTERAENRPSRVRTPRQRTEDEKPSRRTTGNVGPTVFGIFFIGVLIGALIDVSPLPDQLVALATLGTWIAGGVIVIMRLNSS